MNIRLDKYLADMSIGTRSQVKLTIRAGRVSVNDEKVKSADLKINTDTDTIMVDGKTIGYKEFEYYMLNKPAGIITATMDKKAETVLDLIQTAKRKDLFPVGRLDKDTVGLLLITNDGTLAHNMLSPKKHVNKIYYAELDGPLSEDMIKEVCEGVYIETGVKTAPAQLEVLDNSSDSVKINLTIHEGRFHQVKKMFEAVGRTVTFLKRIEFGPLVLDPELEYGQYRLLTENELKLLEIYRQTV